MPCKFNWKTYRPTIDKILGPCYETSILDSPHLCTVRECEHYFGSVHHATAAEIKSTPIKGATADVTVIDDFEPEPDPGILVTGDASGAKCGPVEDAEKPQPDGGPDHLDPIEIEKAVCCLIGDVKGCKKRVETLVKCDTKINDTIKALLAAIDHDNMRLDEIDRRLTKNDITYCENIHRHEQLAEKIKNKILGMDTAINDHDRRIFALKSDIEKRLDDLGQGIEVLRLSTKDTFKEASKEYNELRARTSGQFDRLEKDFRSEMTSDRARYAGQEARLAATEKRVGLDGIIMQRLDHHKELIHDSGSATLKALAVAENRLAALEAAVKDLQKLPEVIALINGVGSSPEYLSVSTPHADVDLSKTLCDSCNGRADCIEEFQGDQMKECHVSNCPDYTPAPTENKGDRCPHASPEPTLVDGTRRFHDCAMSGNKCEEKRCVEGAWRECEHAKGKEAKQKTPQWTGDVCPFYGEFASFTCTLKQTANCWYAYHNTSARKASIHWIDCEHLKDLCPRWTGNVCPFRIFNEEKHDGFCKLAPEHTCCYELHPGDWVQCFQLVGLCPHFRDPVHDKTGGWDHGTCTCDGERCGLGGARKWKTRGDDGTPCPRMLGRVRVEKTEGKP